MRGGTEAAVTWKKRCIGEGKKEARAETWMMDSGGKSETSEEGGGVLLEVRWGVDIER